MRKLLNSLVAVLAVVGIMGAGATLTKTNAEAATCLDGSKYQSYRVSYASRYEGTLSTANGLPICKDQAFVFQSFNFAKTWDGKNFLTSLPQTLHSYTKFTFPAGKANHKMTVKVNAPDLCNPTQIDFYVGGTVINEIPKSNPHYGEDREVRSGMIFTGNKTKCEAPVKTIQVCDLATKKVISIKETDFNSTKHSKNLDDCKPVVVKDIQVCDLATNKVITIKENAYDATKHSKNLDDCKPVVVKDIKVCELSTKKVITIKENAYDATKHSRDLDDCREEVVNLIKVCELSTNKIRTIKETEFDSAKHSMNLEDCKEAEVPVVPAPVEPEQPVVELPQTGFAAGLINVLGASTALGLAVHNIVRRFN